MVIRTICLGAIFLCMGTASAQLYRWVDENGQVHYTDRLPPEAAKQDRETLNKQGKVVGKQNKQKSAEQIKREQEAAAAKAEADRVAAEQAKYDRFLLDSYNSREHLIGRRDDQLAILDASIASGKKSILQSEDTLEKLQTRADGFVKKDRPVPTRIDEQIKEFKSALTTGRKALMAMEKKREKVAVEFERDLSRYDELRPPEQQPPQ